MSWRAATAHALLGEHLRSVKRPATAASPAFSLRYVRSGPQSAVPTLVIPGGPGLASIVPYRTFRKLGVRAHLDLIMIEHRGVGFSRNSVRGEPLPHSAMWITDVLDDIVAVLDREGIDRVNVVGSSYGSYLATSFGSRYPERVAAMVLDSALLSTTDLDAERTRIRELFVDGERVLTANIQLLTSQRGVPEREVLDCVRAAYELGGQRRVRQLVRARLTHRHSLAWKLAVAYAQRDESITRIPWFYEFDVAGAIGFRELHYGAMPDGLPLDPALTYAPLADQFPEFAGEPRALPENMQRFTWPVVFLVGTNDVRTPPEVARRAAKLTPNAHVVTIENGHSALDTHPVALLNVIRFTVRGTTVQLEALEDRISRTSRRGSGARFAQLLALVCAAEGS